MTDKDIDYKKAVDYWSSVTADEDGVLGGYGNSIVPRVDVTGSLTFIKRLQQLSPNTFPNSPQGYTGQNRYILDVGSGIGRVTRDVLSKYSDHVDILEPASPLIAKAKEILDGKVKSEFFEVGLQDFEFPKKYWAIWCQWCLSQGTDEALVEFLRKAALNLQAGGLIIVKENLSTTEQDLFDETDSSISRTDTKFRQLFAQAGLKILLTSLQKGMPRELLPIRMYALAPAQPSPADENAKDEDEMDSD